MPNFYFLKGQNSLLLEYKSHRIEQIAYDLLKQTENFSKHVEGSEELHRVYDIRTVKNST